MSQRHEPFTGSGFKGELDLGQEKEKKTNPLAHITRSEMTATDSLHLEPKRKMEEPSILCSSKRQQKNSKPLTKLTIANGRRGL